jgi:RNA polymerase sigma factor (sigma-70 family)
MEVNEYNLCVHKWTDALFRFACKCTGNPDDAHDVVQNSFVVLWQKRKDVGEEKAKAFLFQVAYNNAIDSYRRKSNMPFKEAPEDSFTPGNPDLKKILETALATLDKQGRALVLLKDYEGYRYREIAEITGLTETQVKVYLHRARKILKDYLVSVENII